MEYEGMQYLNQMKFMLNRKPETPKKAHITLYYENLIEHLAFRTKY